MPIKLREISQTDLPACLAIDPRRIGIELVGEAAALRVWKELIRHPFFTAVTLVREGERRQIVGFAAACMVSARFADSELDNPRAGTNARFIESCSAGRPVVLDRREIARANAGEGVDIIQLYGSVLPDMSLEEQFASIVPMSAKFMEYYCGYRVRTVISECTSEFEERFARGSGSRVIEFKDTNRKLICVTKESMAAMPSSVGAPLFNNSRPLLRLRESDQELLMAALAGGTDDEIGRALGLTRDAVKARWRSTLARIAEVKPDLVTGESNGASRGPQKRHRVIAYVREHLEELRCYDWQVGASRSAGR